MVIAVFVRTQLPLSIQSDITNITRELKVIGVKTIAFSENDAIPKNVDLYWNPGTGRPGPFIGLKKVSKPIVVTFHGVANLALPTYECYGITLMKLLHGYQCRVLTKYEWFIFRKRCAAIISVSKYGKEEFEKYLHFIQSKIIPIYHGVDHAIFYPKDAATTIKPYFLHISAYQPKKNFDRILAAYQKLPEDKPMLLAVIPGYHHKTEIPGVEIIKRSLTHQELSELYRNAYAFIFPSLHETFGHPIMEAMACGCPVMTSNTTSCAEVAGHAALLVNPRSVEEIAAAMGKLLFNYSLCQSLRSKGIERAMQFTWHKCAMEHLAVFNEIKSL